MLCYANIAVDWLKISADVTAVCMTSFFSQLHNGTDNLQKGFNHGQMSSGEFWTTRILKHADLLVTSQNVELLLNSDDATVSAWNSAMKHMKKLSKCRCKRL